jgi:hypothetical protein
MTKPIAVSVLLLGLLLASGFAQAGPLRIALLADTTIQGDTILLAHLLPASVSLEIRRHAENISFGPAPELGSVRTLSRELIQTALREAGLRSAEFTIPERVLVRQEASPLSRERVWAAIMAAAASHRIALPANVGPENIDWAAPTGLPAGNAPLEVREVYLDKLLNQLRFRLRIANSPAAPSFEAWCSLPPRQQSRFSMKLAANQGSQSNRATLRLPGLVSERRLATLHLHSENSLAELQVHPLQSGELGETIRVRVPANGRTLLARISGPDLLDAAF